LVALGAVTHQVNMQQRFLSLEFDVDLAGLDVTMPANANLAPPGPYMLFVLNERGVPSHAAMVQVVGQTAPNPVPVVTGVSPSSVVSGSGGFTLTVSGSEFVPGAVVRVNGANRATTYVSSTSVQASVLASDVTE